LCDSFLDCEDEFHNADVASGCTSEFNARMFHRKTAIVSRRLAVKIKEVIQRYTLGQQQLILEKVFSHALLRDSIPSYLHDLPAIKHHLDIVKNMRRGLTDHLTGQKKQQLTLAKDIVCMLATLELSASHREIAKTLGVDRRNIQRSIVRPEDLDDKGKAFWLSRRCALRSDRLSEEVKQLVLQWWTFHSTVSPNRKDITRCRIGVKQFEEHPRHYLQVSQVCFVNLCSLHCYMLPQV
jgi:hypothetical protein